jgi:hypothetical protein
LYVFICGFSYFNKDGTVYSGQFFADEAHGAAVVEEKPGVLEFGRWSHGALTKKLAPFDSSDPNHVETLSAAKEARVTSTLSPSGPMHQQRLHQPSWKRLPRAQARADAIKLEAQQAAVRCHRASPCHCGFRLHANACECILEPACRWLAVRV